MTSPLKPINASLFENGGKQVVLIKPETGDPHTVYFSNSLHLNRVFALHKDKGALNEEAGRNSLKNKLVQNISGATLFATSYFLTKNVGKNTQATVEQSPTPDSASAGHSGMLDPAHGVAIVAFGMGVAFLALARRSSILARDFFTKAKRNDENVDRLKAAGARDVGPRKKWEPVRFSMGIDGTP